MFLSLVSYKMKERIFVCYLCKFEKDRIFEKLFKEIGKPEQEGRMKIANKDQFICQKKR